MKKIFPLLVVSIFVLSGFGVVATTDDSIPSSLGDMQAEAKGGWGVTVTITNNGNEPYQEQGNVKIFIQYRLRHVYLYGNPVQTHPTLIPIPAGGGSVSLSSELVIGFGISGRVVVEIDIDGDGNIDAEGVKRAIIFGPFVLMGDLLMPLS